MNVCVIGFAAKVSVRFSCIILDMVTPAIFTYAEDRNVISSTTSPFI
jgi:hypothetical protein